MRGRYPALQWCAGPNGGAGGALVGRAATGLGYPSSCALRQLLQLAVFNGSRCVCGTSHRIGENSDRYSAPQVREDRMAQAFRRCAFSEPSELALGLRGLGAAALPMPCAPFSGFLSAVSLGDITVEIVRGTPLLLFETVPEDRLGFKLMLGGSAGASWDGRPVGGTDVALFGGS